MNKYLKRYARNFDYPLFFTVLLLSLFGLVMIYSSSMMVAIAIEEEAPDYFYLRQVNKFNSSVYSVCSSSLFPI